VFEADAVDVAARGGAGLGVEGAGEVARREGRAGRERLDGQVGAGVFGDPLLDLAQRLAPRGLGGQLGAELGLVAGPAQEHHQVPGDGEGGLPAEVLLDQGERQVDAGGDARGRGDVAVTDEDGIGVDVDGRVVAGQGVAVGPVRGGAAAVEQSGVREQHGAGADGDQPLGARSVSAQPVGQPRIGPAGSLPAGHQQRVRLRRVGQGPVRYDGQAAAGADGGAVHRGGAQPVAPRGVLLGAREDLHGAGDIEALHVVEEDDENGSLRHAVDSSPGP
jgi:hypothetical protein